MWRGEKDTTIEYGAGAGNETPRHCHHGRTGIGNTISVTNEHVVTYSLKIHNYSYHS